MRCWSADAGLKNLEYAPLVELIGRVDRAIHASGGAGVTEDYRLPYIYKCARTLRIVDGPGEIHGHQLRRQELAKQAAARAHG